MATKKKSPAKKPAAKKKAGKSNMNYATPKKAVAVKAKPRAQRLPGMDDPKIARLESLAHDYADVRDSRISLSVKEGELKSDIMAEMKRLKREHYKRDGVEITLVHEKENVKVKIKPTSDFESATMTEVTDGKTVQDDFEPAEV